MRLAYLLPTALFLTGCGVPEVTYTDAGGSGGRDATHDSPEPMDAQGDADAEPGTDAQTDAADAGDASDSGSPYCKGDAGAPDSGNYSCCSTGTVCNGPCTSPDCLQCVGCAWPNVCCSKNGMMAACKPPGSC